MSARYVIYLALVALGVALVIGLVQYGWLAVARRTR